MNKVERGFTLIELTVAITILGVLIAGSLVYINRFNSRQKLNAVREEIVAYLRMARDYAISLQNPDGDDLTYVKVDFEDGMMKAWPNGIGSTYFAKEVAPAGVAVSMDSDLLFSAYEGKVMMLDVGNSLVPVDIGETVTISVAMEGDLSSSTTIKISSSGLIN